MEPDETLGPTARKPESILEFAMRFNTLKNELREVAESMLLPNGDHINLATQEWLQGLLKGSEQ